MTPLRLHHSPILSMMASVAVLVIPWLGMGPTGSTSLAAAVAPIPVGTGSAPGGGAGRPPVAMPPELVAIGDAAVAGISFADLPEDDGLITPFAHDLDAMKGDPARSQAFAALVRRLRTWKPGLQGDAAERIRAWCCLAALADLGESSYESELPVAILGILKRRMPRAVLVRGLAWVALEPEAGAVTDEARSLGLNRCDPPRIRERAAIYARKFLGRIVGKLPPPP